MSSPDPTRKPSSDALLAVARRAIDHGVRYGQPPAIDPAEYAPELRELRATFVTLHLDGRLRGCIGSLEPARPLVADVAHSAYAAAFGDPRFPPVTPAEADRLEIHIAVLSPLARLEVRDEAGLLRALRPGVDGVLLRAHGRQGTFLPQVWESLPDPRDFVRELKHKAGLPRDAWEPDWEVWRYTVTSIS